MTQMVLKETVANNLRIKHLTPEIVLVWNITRTKESVVAYSRRVVVMDAKKKTGRIIEMSSGSVERRTIQKNRVMMPTHSGQIRTNPTMKKIISDSARTNGIKILIKIKVISNITKISNILLIADQVRISTSRTSVIDGKINANISSLSMGNTMAMNSSMVKKCRTMKLVATVDQGNTSISTSRLDDKDLTTMETAIGTTNPSKISSRINTGRSRLPMISH